MFSSHALEIMKLCSLAPKLRSLMAPHVGQRISGDRPAKKPEPGYFSPQIPHLIVVIGISEVSSKGCDMLSPMKEWQGYQDSNLESSDP